MITSFDISSSSILKDFDIEYLIRIIIENKYQNLKTNNDKVIVYFKSITIYFDIKNLDEFLRIMNDLFNIKNIKLDREPYFPNYELNFQSSKKINFYTFINRFDKDDKKSFDDVFTSFNKLNTQEKDQLYHHRTDKVHSTLNENINKRILSIFELIESFSSSIKIIKIDTENINNFIYLISIEVSEELTQNQILEFIRKFKDEQLKLLVDELKIENNTELIEYYKDIIDKISQVNYSSFYY
jgi:hypothetical protein